MRTQGFVRLMAGFFMAAVLFHGCCKQGGFSFKGWDSLRGVYFLRGIEGPSSADSAQKELLKRLAEAAEHFQTGATIEIIYPQKGSLFPPDFVAPRFFWNDGNAASDAWFLKIGLEGGGRILTVALNTPPPPPDIDSNCITSLTQLPQTRKENSWRPSSALWTLIKKHSIEKRVSIIFFGFRRRNPKDLLSTGQVAFMTSRDSVRAPIFYRDVPIMPSRNKEGKIKPLSRKTQRLINWRLRDVSKEQSRVVMSKVNSCANCHSFSRDGNTLGMDVDGPQSDKGAYVLKSLSRNMAIHRKDLFSWNHDFKEKPKGAKTLGFLSQVSPSGIYVITTVNEKLFVTNFMHNDFIQVFYPTRGVLAFYNSTDRKIRLLPGADDTAFVHCDPVWTPDEKQIIFARARARNPYVKGMSKPKKANDPEETRIQYDLYRMPFNGGRGGKPEPVKGASGNGMSNNFPKVSPDGKWIVFVQCKNGQLMRPDSKLWMVPVTGGIPRLMNCNTSLMNSWHSFSPNGRWMVFSSKAYSFYTQMFLTHIDEDGMDSPPILIPNSKPANRAVNIPEFVNRPYDSLAHIALPAVSHFKHILNSKEYLKAGRPGEAVQALYKALKAVPDDNKFVAEILVLLGWITENREQGLDFMKRALEKDPGYFGAHFDMGVLYHLMGREKEAIGSLENALKIIPEAPLALGKLAEIYGGSANPDIRDIPGAVRLAHRANELTYFSRDILLVTLGRVLFKAGRMDEAVHHLSRAVLLFKEEEELENAREIEKEIQVIKSRTGR